MSPKKILPRSGSLHFLLSTALLLTSCSALHHVPGITPGVRLLWPRLTSAQSHHKLPHGTLLLSTFNHHPAHFLLFRVFLTARYQTEAYLTTPGLGQPVAPAGHFFRWLMELLSRNVKQISPDKSINFPCTTASFTVSPESRGFVMLC